MKEFWEFFMSKKQLKGNTNKEFPNEMRFIHFGYLRKLAIPDRI